MSRRFAVLAVVMVAACASGGVPDELRARSDDGETAPAGCGGESDGPEDLTAEPALRRTAERYRWRDQHGCPIRVDVIVHLRGDDEHCDMGSVEIIRVGTPLGTSIDNFSDPEVRTFVWDPSNVLGPTDDVDRSLTIDRGQLPSTAIDSGYRLDGVELWTDSGSDDVLYRVRDDRAQVLMQDINRLSRCA